MEYVIKIAFPLASNKDIDKQMQKNFFPKDLKETLNHNIDAFINIQYDDGRKKENLLCWDPKR
jgi:hypothetical protein